MGGVPKERKASHRASSAAGMKARPVRPLAKMDWLSARIVGERKYSLEVVLSFSRTSIHAPHRLDSRDILLAERKFWTHNEIPSDSGHARGLETIGE